jgi:drug/metabolite transporter (DMT)-like permease
MKSSSYEAALSLCQVTDPLSLKALGWVAMFLAMMSGASIGPMFKYLENQHIAPLMAASWRCQCMLFFLIPMAAIESKYNPTQWFETKPGLTYPVIVYILIAGVSWAGNLLSWSLSPPSLSVGLTSLTPPSPLSLSLSTGSVD